jgi:hypothetical protein
MKISNNRWVALTASLLILVTLFQQPVSAQQLQVYTASEPWSVGHGEYIRDSGIPACGQQPDLNVFQTAANLIRGYTAGGVYGSLAATLPQVIRTAGLGGTVESFLDQFFHVERYANCVSVGVVIPRNPDLRPHSSSIPASPLWS